MAIVKRFKELLDLDEIDVLIDDVDKSKHIIISDMPESLPQGRSSFLIETSPFMRDGVELQIDFIDSEGNSIYTEPVADYLEGTSRRVSMEVYSDTAAGIATLIIVGELETVPEDGTIFSNATAIPPEFDGFYNVRLTKEVIINPTAVNTQPIKFFNQPTIRVVETQLGTMVRSEITGSITSSLFNIEGSPTDRDLLFKPFGAVDEEISQGILSEVDTTVPSKQKGSKAFVETRKLKFRKGLRKNSAGKRSGFSAKRNSPVKFPYLLRIGDFDGDETFRFNTKHIGGTVQFSDSSLGNLFTNSEFYPTDVLDNVGLNLETPTYDTSKVPTLTNVTPTPYTASIVDLVNDRTAMVEFPFTNKNNNGENIVLPIFAKGQILFESMPTGSYAEANLVSYADIQLNTMRTFSGDIFKVKVYVKSEGGFDDFKLLAEVPLEGRELLVDDASVGQGERTGYPIKQKDISDYWDVYGGTDGLFEMPAAAADLSASYSNEKMLDSILISGSLNNDEHQIRFQLKDEYSFQLKPGIDYTLSGRIVGERKHNKTAVLLMYVSGSSMKQKKSLYNYPNTRRDIEESSDYGQRLGALEINSDDDLKKDFGLLTHNFTPNISGSGVLQLRALHGEWNVSDLSITPSDDTGFSPSFFQFQQELPAALSHKRPDKFEFLVEFYDVNNNISDTVIYEKDIIFQGTNMTITGNDNVLESSLFIGGDTIGGGMHLGGVTSTLPETGGAGAEGSGFMRSVGYEGFISASAQSGSYGFMIYSGSVLPDSGDNYSGVGLELVGASGSFKFRTNPSLFDVRADAFFVGRRHENSPSGIGQFISGSGGDIEISSSLFHLDPANDSLIIGAGTTINADLTANTIRTPAFIGVDGGGSPAQSTDLNASSSINSQGLARFVSASIGGWTVGTGSIESAGGSLVLDPAGRQFRVSDGSNDRVHLGQTATGEFGMKIFDGTGVADSDILVELGQGGNTIGGFEITADQITGGELVLDRNGTIKSAGFQQDVAGSGFILTAAQGGFLEVENAKIRGTMATTTFEKESVNAVGGQLYVANSTTLTSSAFPTTLASGGRTEGNYPANETTMSVANVSGFSVGEILVLKKVTDTGFSTEYVRVESSSLAAPGSDTDLSGQLYLIRGYSGSQPTGQDSSSLGDTASAATFYSGSQVIVSTGKIGTGFVRINANPNDTATPYMDIVERTGSAIYDTELKVRLGDLSGVAGSRNVPSGFTGFGLMSEVAFLSGSQIKLEAPTFLLGDLNQNFVSGSNSNIEISSSKFHIDSKNEFFSVGQPTGSRILFDGTDLIMSSSNFVLGGGSQFVSGSNGNIEMKSDNFHLTPEGNVTMSGDLSAQEGTFQDISVMGSLVPNANATGSNDGHKVVETWIDETFNATGGGYYSISAHLSDLSASSWGWTPTLSSGNPRNMSIRFSDGDGTSPTVAQMALTPEDTRSDAAGDPPPSVFKSIGQAEGRAKGSADTRESKYLYDANAYHNSGNFGKAGGIPKMGVDLSDGNGSDVTSGARTEGSLTVTLTSAEINIPLTQSDLFECFLEFAIRDAGNFAGFQQLSQVKILKASDDSVLYGDAQKHNGTGDWSIWSIPMCTKAELIKSAGTAIQGAAFTLTTAIKIELKVGFFTSDVMSTYQGKGELNANLSGGGGTLDGFIITEMRMRRAPYLAVLETENAVISDLYARAPNDAITTRGVHKAVERFQAPMFRGSDSDTYFDTSNSNQLRFYANNQKVIDLTSSGIKLDRQPAFLARKGSNQNNLTAGSDNKITFGTEIYDVLSNFASSTFSAARTGKYVLYSVIRFQGSGLDTSKHYTLKFVTSNRTYRVGQVAGNTTSGITIHGTIVADMDASDTAEVHVAPQSGAGDTSDVKGDSSVLMTYFGGYFLG
tara:strand:+ start:2501 stop:8158 length:5658 start_codon:yes stop_codon:yes gene_type:complete